MGVFIGAFCIFRHSELPVVAVVPKVVVSIPAHCNNDDDKDYFLQRGAPLFLGPNVLPKAARASTKPATSTEPDGARSLFGHSLGNFRLH